MAGPNREVLIPHLCLRSGNGVSVPADGPTEANLFAAVTIVIDCETGSGACPADCELKKLAQTDDFLQRYKQSLGLG